MSRNADDLRRYRAAAVSAGLCQQCRCRPQKSGCKTCQHCLDVHTERAMSRKANRLCECGARPTAGFRRCIDCRERINARRRLNRDVARAQGMCTAIGCDRAAETSRAMCFEHLRESSERMKRTKRKRAARGLCVACPNLRVSATMCAECLAKMAARPY